MVDVIVWVTDRSTGEDLMIYLSVTDGYNIENEVDAWISSHPEYETSGWDYA